jgi:hypothetical protein
MNRPALEVADIFRAFAGSFIERSRARISWPLHKVLRAIERCRTAALGKHRDRCSQCGEDLGWSFNSCRNRHCPKCQVAVRNRWVAARTSELVPVTYYHVVFTVPHQLSPLMLQNKRLLYNLLFRCASATLLEVAANPKRLGAEIGFLCVLHTWGQTLIPICIAWCRPVASPPAAPLGCGPSPPGSSCPNRCSARSSEASSTMA